MKAFKRGDIVANDRMAGMVVRVAKDEAWVDVKWGHRTERQHYPHILLAPTGYTIQDALRWLDNWSRRP